ncbi:hypothetical protein J5491_01950 [Candidatus Saccharibacteria bacterium]|nr:hypothetical protein [Candidatus Saccharibacteria bacterium]
MAEKLPKRPIEASDNDFDGLDDWTVTDIATAKNTNPKDRQNAEAEIARREAAGEFDIDNYPEDAVHDVQQDFLVHGYGVNEEGEILYPTDEYREYMENGFEGKAPEVAREALSDRARKATASAVAETREKVKQEQKEINEANNKSYVEDYLDSEDSFFEAMKRDENKKAVKPEKPRGNKNKDKGHKKEMREHEFEKERINVTPREVQENLTTKEEYVEHEKTPAEKMERALDVAEFRLNKHMDDYYVLGAMKSLADGDLAINPRGFIKDGFKEAEGKDLENKINEDQVEEFWQDFTLDSVNEKAAEWSVDEEKLHDAEKRALMSSIALGAFVEHTSLDEPEKLRIALPIEQHGDGALQSFMEKNGVELEQGGESSAEAEAVRDASFQGFANIVEAIKDNPDFTEEGFKALDWYFDNFKYGNKTNLDQFMGAMDAYEEISDDAWSKKLEEYFDSRKEIRDYFERQKKQEIPTLAEVEKITEEDLNKMYEDMLAQMERDSAVLGIPYIFPRIERFPIYNHTGAVPPVNMPPTSAQKLGKVVQEFTSIKATDPFANVYKVVFQDSNNKNKDYIVLRYGVKNSNVAIAVPISNRSNDAAYVWIGQTGSNPDGWQDAFVKDPNSPLYASKYQARQRDDVRVHNHIAAMKTRGMNATDNMWYNIYKDIEKRAI